MQKLFAMSASHLSHALLALFDRRGYTATSVGKDCGIHQVTVSRACAGERLSVDSLRALCTRQVHPRDGLDLLLAHLRDEVERGGRSQTEVAITASDHDTADDILLLEEQARDDAELSAIIHDLAEMVRAVRRKLARAAAYPQAADTTPLQLVAEEQAPFGAPTVVADMDRRVVAVSEAFVRLCGHPREALIGRSLREVLHGPATEPEAAARIKRALAARQPIDTEITNHHADGHPYRVRLRIHPTNTGYSATATPI